MIRRPPRSTLSSSSAASDVYKRQDQSLHRRLAHRQVVRHLHHRRPRQSPRSHRRRPVPRRRRVADGALHRPDLRRRGELRHPVARPDRAAERAARAGRMKRFYLPLIVVALAVLAALPWFGSDTLIQFGINTLLLAVLAQGWNIIGGYTGYASFGNSVFYGLGSYCLLYTSPSPRD